MNEAVLERDGWRCLRCGSAGPLHVHHRILGNRKDNRLSNLLTLCLVCHQAVHASGARGGGGWIVSRHGPREATETVRVWTRFGPAFYSDDGGVDGRAREAGDV